MTDSNYDQTHEQIGEYTRFRAKIQLGDGPDARGEVTVETVRKREETDDLDALTDGRMIRVGKDGLEVPVMPNDAAFAEFYNELDRATDALTEQLRLNDDEDE